MIAATHTPPAVIATAALLLALTLVVASVTDLRHRIIPDRLTGPAAVAGLALAFVADGPAGAAVALGCGLTVAAPLYLAARLRPRGMGMGDAKLAAVIGIYLGLAAWWVLLSGLALAAFAGALLAMGRRTGVAEVALPLAPFLAAGSLPVLVVVLMPPA